MFKHALTHDVVYGTLLERERRQIHARVARLIEEIYADRLPEFYEILAFQHAGACNTARAAHYEWLAGERAAKHLGSEALTHLRRAIELAKGDESARDTLRASLSAFAGVLFRSGRIADANAALKEALEITFDDDARRVLQNRIEQEHVVTFDGAPVLYYVCGTAHDPREQTPIVFFHPLIQASIAFQDAAQRLARKRPVVFIDAPAGSGTQGHETFDVEKRLGAMIAALEDLPYERVILFGDSDGVRFALSVYERMPERVERMILFGYAMGLRSADNPRGLSEEEILGWDAFVDSDYDTLIERFFGLMFDEPGTSVFQEVVTDNWRKLWPESLAKSFFRDVIRSDVSALAKQVRVPTLIMAAERDSNSPQRMRQYLEWIPGAKFAEIKGASHSAPFTQCSTFCTIMETFLETGTLPKEQWSASDA